VRASNTEPVIRIIAEAPTETEASQLAQRVMEYLRPPGV
jgi:phosphomannomutase